MSTTRRSFLGGLVAVLAAPFVRNAIAAKPVPSAVPPGVDEEWLAEARKEKQRLEERAVDSERGEMFGMILDATPIAEERWEYTWIKVKGGALYTVIRSATNLCEEGGGFCDMRRLPVSLHSIVRIRKSPSGNYSFMSYNPLVTRHEIESKAKAMGEMMAEHYNKVIAHIIL